MELEINKEYPLKKLIGKTPSVTIQAGMWDTFTAKITHIRLYDGKIQFYWDYWDYGWKTYNELKSDGKRLAREICEKLELKYE